MSADFDANLSLLQARVALLETLKAGGYDSTLETFPGVTHWPAAEGLIRAQDFIVEQLGG